MPRSPSIVPEDSDRDVYLILEDFGPLGRAWRETDEAETVTPNQAAPLSGSNDGSCVMSYKIVATKEDETMRWVRQSLLIAAAKARVWASEGWQVVVTDGEERTLDPADFEKLFELKQVSTLTLGAADPQSASEPEMA